MRHRADALAAISHFAVQKACQWRAKTINNGPEYVVPRGSERNDAQGDEDDGADGGH
jgi:hypothetical protein